MRSFLLQLPIPCNSDNLSISTSNRRSTRHKTYVSKALTSLLNALSCSKSRSQTNQPFNLSFISSPFLPLCFCLVPSFSLPLSIPWNSRWVSQIRILPHLSNLHSHTLTIAIFHPRFSILCGCLYLSISA